MVAWLVYRTFLKRVSIERHKTLQRQFRSCLTFTFVTLPLLGAFQIFYALPENTPGAIPIFSAFGLVILTISCIWIVKVMRVSVFIGSFITHLQVPVPLLLINVITIVFGMSFALMVASEVLEISLAPLLATSAIVSIVVGLALQDTLGNILSGIALQFDKPYRIGDWIEIINGSQKTSGQVFEITWRATVLLSFTDELITLPNRIVAQAQISNFTQRPHPVLRGHHFKLQADADFSKLSKAMVDCISLVPGIHRYPEPMFLVLENGDSWVSCKLIYYIVDFGKQFLVGDEVLRVCYSKLNELGVRLAVPKYQIDVEHWPS